MTNLLDVILPMLPFPNLWVGMCIAPLAIPAIEAVVLRLLRWGPWRHCILDAVIVNIVTTGIGIGVVIVGAKQLQWLAMVGLAFALSVAVEGGLLWLIRRKPQREVWRTSLAMNVASYGVLLALSALLDG